MRSDLYTSPHWKSVAVKKKKRINQRLGVLLRNVRSSKGKPSRQLKPIIWSVDDMEWCCSALMRWGHRCLPLLLSLSVLLLGEPAESVSVSAPSASSLCQMEKTHPIVWITDWRHVVVFNFRLCASSRVREIPARPLTPKTKCPPRPVAVVLFCFFTPHWALSKYLSTV